MATVPLATTWSDLVDLLDAGVSVESALGIEDDSKDPPSPRTFKQNLVINGIGDQKEEFQFHIPDASDIELFGLPEISENFTVLPPFLDLCQLLQPLFICGPESCDGVQRSNSEECSMDIKKCTNLEGNKRPREDSASPVQTGSGFAIETPEIREQSAGPESLNSSSESEVFDLTQCS